MTRRLLLLSNSTVYGRRYLEHAADDIRRFFATVGRVLFVPYALDDRDAYAKKARETFEELGLALDSIHSAPDPAAAVAEAEGMFIGGGNTFRLLDALQRLNLVDAIRHRVTSGMPYMGSSAGSVIAAPTLRTTNDMPIVQPQSFDALGLISFQINGHYLDPDPASTHMGETRETRIREFHEMNAAPVAGLREGTWLRVDGPRVELCGSGAARIFVRGSPPYEVPAGSTLELEV
ncbi:MAG TPA: dipeptidase PepE [Thermoanaerobaculia bacterium]|nr:dipeptidase PepE [Thermoanaerobaculia bacterium]